MKKIIGLNMLLVLCCSCIAQSVELSQLASTIEMK